MNIEEKYWNKTLTWLFMAPYLILTFQVSCLVKTQIDSFSKQGVVVCFFFVGPTADTGPNINGDVHVCIPAPCTMYNHVEIRPWLVTSLIVDES